MGNAKYFIPILGLVVLAVSFSSGRHLSDEANIISIVVALSIMPAIIVVFRLYGFLRRRLADTQRGVPTSRSIDACGTARPISPDQTSSFGRRPKRD